jgi:class 3 adenylate cyclase
MPALARNIQISYENKEMAILVSDLSGFTSTTRKWGIVHFASVIVRMRQLCLPILNNRGAVFITTEADNFIVIFPDTTQAVMAGLEMQ